MMDLERMMRGGNVADEIQAQRFRGDTAVVEYSYTPNFVCNVE